MTNQPPRSIVVLLYQVQSNCPPWSYLEMVTAALLEKLGVKAIIAYKS